MKKLFNKTAGLISIVVLIAGAYFLNDVFETFILETSYRFTINTHPRFMSSRMPDNEGIRIISRRAREFQETFIINASTEPNTLISSREGDLIGIVIESSASASKVRTISAPGTSVDAVLERSGIPLRLIGKGAGVLEAKIPRGSDVEKGDVVRAGQDSSLKIGAIFEVEDTPADPFFVLRVLQNTNLSSIGNVLVVEPRI